MSQKEAKKSDEKESIDLSESLSKEDKILECKLKNLNIKVLIFK